MNVTCALIQHIDKRYMADVWLLTEPSCPVIGLFYGGNLCYQGKASSLLETYLEGLKADCVNKKKIKNKKDNYIQGV